MARRLWAIALMALACAAALGGTYHGFAPLLGQGVLQLLWKATVLTIGLSAFCMFAGSTKASTLATSTSPTRTEFSTTA